jgi:hypothetical protein
MTPNIPLIAWAPDADPTTPGVLVDVENMLPTQRGYASEPGLDDSSSYALSLGTVPAGATTLTYKAGHVPFVATALTLTGFVGGTWSMLNRTTPAYTAASADDPWRFASFSTPSSGVIALAVQAENILQAKTDSTAGPFVNVTAAPSASCIATHRGFVLLANYTTGSTLTPDGWICSALEDYTDWTPDIATQSASGRLTATPGEIVRLVPFRDYVIAFKRYSMYRGTYVGAADNTWAWPVVSRSVGLVAHDAVCEAEGVLYWLGYDGFYRYGGGEVQRIASAPWEWLQASFSNAAFLGVREQCVWDGAQRVVRWQLYYSLAGTTQKLQLTYHPDTDRWGKRLTPDLGAMFLLPSVSVFTSPKGTKVSSPAVGYMVKDGTNYVLSIARESGAAGPSSATTGDIGDDDQVFALTRVRARYTTFNGAGVATHYYRMNLDEALTTGATSFRIDGKFDISHAARWHRVKFAQTDMSEIAGFSVETPRAGKR